MKGFAVGSRRCACRRSFHETRLVAVTGGPGAGKTAVLELALRSFCSHVGVLPEAASVVFGGGFPRHDTDVGRRAAQRAIYHIQRQLEARLPTYLNSPMAIDTTHIYCRHQPEHRLSEDQCRLMCNVAKYVNRVEDSRALNELDHPAIILSASGMATGGRIVHHLKAYLPDAKNAVLFVGFQARGTRGRALVDGATSVRIHGEDVPARAEVLSTDALSAHADADELVAWAARIDPPPHTTFVTHGEPDASSALADRLRDELRHTVEVPQLGQRFDLD